MEYGQRTIQVRHNSGTTGDADDKTGFRKVKADIEYPIYSDFEEFVTAAGSPEAGLAFINSAARENTGDKTREFITEAPEDMAENEIIAKAQAMAKTSAPVVSATNKEKAVSLDQLLARVRTEGAESVQDDLLELAARLA